MVRYFIHSGVLCITNGSAAVEGKDYRKTFLFSIPKPEGGRTKKKHVRVTVNIGLGECTVCKL